MKKRFILTPLILAVVYVICCGYPDGPGTYGYERTGATGSPGCSPAGCHASVATPAVALELDTVTGASVSTYYPGGSYIIKIWGTNTSPTFTFPDFGFQLTSVRLTGAGTSSAVYAGTLATTGLPANTHNVTVGSLHLVEHTAATPFTTGSGGMGSTYVRSIGWTAPVTGTGTVKFYTVINLVNGTGGTDGDANNTSNLTVPEHVAPITGSAFTVCVGSDITLSDVTTGGTWSSGSTSIATVTTGGVVHGVSAGTAVITYSAGTSGTDTALVTVIGPPSAGSISGATAICAGSTLSLTNPTGASGGTWSTTTPAVISINSSTGFVTGLSAGTANVTYTVTGTCGSANTNTSFTVNASPNAGTLTGADSICIGSATSVTSSGSGGGSWNSSATGIATVDGSGNVYGAATGITTISYTVTTPSCGNATSTHIVKVKGPTNAGTLSGSSSLCVGATMSLTPSVAGGTWSSSPTAVATVNSVTGIIGGAGGGTANITYTVTGFCGTATVSSPVTVNTVPDVNFISGSTLLCTGTSTIFHDPVAGGTWTIVSPSVATVTLANSDSAIVLGLSSGTSVISYTASNSCGSASTTRTLTVNDPIIPGSITGATTVCSGTSISFTYSGSAGTGSTLHWHSTNTSVATIGLTTGIGNALTAGTTAIGLDVNNGCSHDTTSVTLTVNPGPVSGTISGPTSVCIGSSITLIDGAPSGTWSVTNTSIATINSSGQVFGVSAGTDTVYYTVTNGCGTGIAPYIITVNSTPSAGTLSGASTVCQGAVTTLTPSVSGGTWTSGATGTATVNSSGGVTGVSPGNVTITYTVANSCGSVQAFQAMTVNPLPSAGTITGGGSVCQGATLSLSGSGSGGTWSSSNTAFATVNSSGTVTGVSPGTVTISYTVSNGCGTANTLHTVVVNPPTSAGTISGSAFVCIGSSSSLTSTVSGGSWSTSDGSIVTINSSGMATGVSIGSVTITYTVTGTCGAGMSFYTVSSGMSASAGTITGPSSVCVGSSISLVDLAGSGTWSSSAPGTATVNGTTGVVTGVSGGTATISYIVSSSCGVAHTTMDIIVNPLPDPGVISGPSTACTGTPVALSESQPGGTWSTTAPGIATVDASGNVFGVSAGTVIVVYSSSNACGTVTALHTMVVQLTPAVAVINGASSLCAGNSTILTASLPGGTWSDVNSAASVSSSGVVTGTGFGIDTINYTISNACGTATASFVDTVYPTSVPGGIAGSVNACIGDTFYYSSVVTGGSWTLSNGNATIDPITGMLIPVSTGLDTLTYSFTNICGTFSGTMEINVLTAAQCALLGVNNAAGIKDIRIYPNPTSGVFNIEMPAAGADVSVTITDVTGKVVLSGIIDGGKTNASFDMSHFASGSYMIRIKASDHTFRDKLVVW